MLQDLVAQNFIVVAGVFVVVVWLLSRFGGGGKGGPDQDNGKGGSDDYGT